MEIPTFKFVTFRPLFFLPAVLFNRSVICTNPPLPAPPREARPLTFTQSDILACHWATLPLILDAQQVWIRRRPRGSKTPYKHIDLRCLPWSGEAPPFDETCTPPPPSPSPTSSSRHKPDEPNHTIESARDCFEADWRFFAGPHDRSCRITCWESTYIGVHPCVRIPEALLAGPFDREKIRRLFWLRSNWLGAARLGTWEVTKQGFDSVMRLDRPDGSDGTEDDDGEADQLALWVLQLFDSWDVFGADWPAHVREEAATYLKSQVQIRGNRLPRACRFAYKTLLRWVDLDSDPIVRLLTK